MAFQEPLNCMELFCYMYIHVLQTCQPVSDHNDVDGIILSPLAEVWNVEDFNL